MGSEETGKLLQGSLSAMVSEVLRHTPHRQEPEYPQPPLPRDLRALQRSRGQQDQPRDREALPSVVAEAAISDPDLRDDTRGAGDSASATGLRERILRARPGRGDVEIRCELRGQSIARERTRPHSAVLDRSSGRAHRGGRPDNVSVWLEAHPLQL